MGRKMLVEKVVEYRCPGCSLHLVGDSHMMYCPSETYCPRKGVIFWVPTEYVEVEVKE